MTDTRVCAVADCGKKLPRDPRTPWCETHWRAERKRARLALAKHGRVNHEGKRWKSRAFRGIR